VKFQISLVVFIVWSCCVSGFAAGRELLVNRRLAERLRVKAGDFVDVAATGDMKNVRSFKIAAIYEEKPDPYQVPLRRSMVKMHLADLENLLDKQDQLDLISIQVKRGTDARKLTARLNLEAIGFTAYSAQELAMRTSTTFEVVSRFHKAIALITMTAGAIFIFALMVMRVEDQRKNLAILNVTGISKHTILKSLMLESVFFAFFASVLGAVFGIAAAVLVNAYYRNYYDTSLVFAHVSNFILLKAVCISFLLGIIAGTFSWFRMKRLVVLEELGR
jgi:ABC-type lipoprotein release transport system permease subunit